MGIALAVAFGSVVVIGILKLVVYRVPDALERREMLVEVPVDAGFFATSLIVGQALVEYGESGVANKTISGSTAGLFVIFLAANVVLILIWQYLVRLIYNDQFDTATGGWSGVQYAGAFAMILVAVGHVT